MRYKTIFLGGTCGDNNWREDLISILKQRGFSCEQIFDPVVEDWNLEAQRKEDQIKSEQSTLMVYYLGDSYLPENRFSGYSLLEAAMSLYDKPERTIVCFEYPNSLTPESVKKSYCKCYEDLTSRFPDSTILLRFDSLVEELDTILTERRVWKETLSDFILKNLENIDIQELVEDAKEKGELKYLDSFCDSLCAMLNHQNELDFQDELKAQSEMLDRLNNIKTNI